MKHILPLLTYSVLACPLFAAESPESVAGGYMTMRATADLKLLKATGNALVEQKRASATDGFSKYLTAYGTHPSALEKSVEEIFSATMTDRLPLHPAVAAKRREVIKMYLDFGLDISVGKEALPKFRPNSWSPTTRKPLSGSYDAFSSEDACYYHKIALDCPRVPLPAEFVSAVNIKLQGDSDDNFKGFMISGVADPVRKIFALKNKASKGADTRSDAKEFTLHIGNEVADKIPSKAFGDRNMSFLDTAVMPAVVVSCYKTRINPNGFDVDCDFSAGPAPVGTLGDRGFGGDAAKIPNMAINIRDGEATDPLEPICHAIGGPIGGPIGKNWKAIVYPALSWDGHVDSINNGLLPYNAVVQLDHELDLNTYRIDGRLLTLPARRILEAIQSYGYYVIDHKPDKTPDPAMSLAIWTMANVREYAPFKREGFRSPSESVSAEIHDVLKTSQLYVVVPQVRK